jgi:hypothetical protein
VVFSPEEAADLMRRGTNVVLVLDPNAAPAVCPTGGPGRVAVMVGDSADPAVRAAAREMVAELF